MSVEVDKDILEITEYLYNNYPRFKSMFPKWKLLSILDKNMDKVAFIREDGKLKGAALFFKLTDSTLFGVDVGFISLKDPEVVKKVIEENGENIHFIGVLADNMKTVLRGLKEVIKKENPKTVSWFKEDMNKVHFIKLRGQSCHLSHSQQQ